MIGGVGQSGYRYFLKQQDKKSNRVFSMLADVSLDGGLSCMVKEDLHWKA